MKLSYIAAILGLISIQETLSSRILFLLPFSGRSHFMFIYPIIQELASRGHELTVLTPYSEKNANYTEIIVEKKMVWELFGERVNMFDLESVSFERMLYLAHEGGYFTTESAFNATNVKQFIKEDNSHFDLIIAEMFYHESMYMFAHKYKAPLIGICTMGYAQFVGDTMGSPLLPSYMTHEYLNFAQPLAFINRISNLYSTVYDLLRRRFNLLPKHQLLADKNFADLPQPLPQLRDLEKNFSIIFVNSHFSYDIVRPYVPGIVDIGGVHIKKPKPLPQDIQKFLDDAEHGAIFFSFGTNLQMKDMPADKIKLFLNVFKRMKQRVLWKWESENLEGKPDNVLVGKWLPQNDILAHPNVKVFITHAGLLSIQEAMYHGVPVIGIPFFGDQKLNADRVEKTGYGKRLTFLDLTENILSDTLNDLIYNSKYQNIAKSLAVKFKDRPMTPLETTIYWIEYVIRHKGATFLRSPALNMSVFSYFMFDIILFFSLILSSIVIIAVFLLKYFKKCKKTENLCANGKKHN